MPPSAALSDLRASIGRRFGETANESLGAVLRVSGLERLLGPGGIPRGKLTEVFGARSSGKTALAFAALAACARAGELAAYVDCAASFFAPAAARAGVDVRRLIVARPASAAAARRCVDALVRDGACAAVVLDCGESFGGELRTQQCARLVAQAEKSGTALLVVSAGNLPAAASFATLRVRACGLQPLWQDGSDGGAQLLGATATFEVAKARMAVRRHVAEFALVLPDVVDTWPLCEGSAEAESRGLWRGESLDTSSEGERISRSSGASPAQALCRSLAREGPRAS